MGRPAEPGWYSWAMFKDRYFDGADWAGASKLSRTGIAAMCCGLATLVGLISKAMTGYSISYAPGQTVSGGTSGWLFAAFLLWAGVFFTELPTARRAGHVLRPLLAWWNLAAFLGAALAWWAILSDLSSYHRHLADASILGATGHLELGTWLAIGAAVLGTTASLIPPRLRTPRSARP